MPAQTRQTNTSTSTSQAVGDNAPTQEVVQARGNGAAADQVGPEVNSGLANYEAALGTFLGGELYKAVSGALAYDKLNGYANSALDGAAAALVGQLGKTDGVTADPKALDTLAQLLSDKLEPFVQQWMEQHGADLQASLSGWAGAHPKTIATVALLAAVGAVLANADIPTLKQKFKIMEGVSGSIEADLGKLRDLSLQKIRGKIDIASGPLIGAIEVGRENGKTDASGSLTIQDGTRKLSVDGAMDDKGMKLFGLHGALGTDLGNVGADVKGGRDTPTIGSVSLTRQDGSILRTDDFTYDASSGVFTLGRAALMDFGGGTTLNQTMRGGSDGSSETGLAFNQTNGANQFNASWTHSVKPEGYKLTEEDKIQLGLKYSREDLKAQLDAALSSTGSGSLKGSVKKDLGGNWSAGGDISASWGNKDLLEVGAFYGFRDPKEFRTFLLDYRHKSGLDEDQFGLLVEQQLGSVYVRWQSQVTQSNTGSNLSSTLQGARPVDGNTSLIAGIKYDKNLLTGQNSFSPQVGVQYKGIPVVLTYEPERKAVMIGITIPFGR